MAKHDSNKLQGPGIATQALGSTYDEFLRLRIRPGYPRSASNAQELDGVFAVETWLWSARVRVRKQNLRCSNK